MQNYHWITYDSDTILGKTHIEPVNSGVLFHTVFKYML